MVYKVTTHTPSGVVYRTLKVPELKEKAREGDRRAIKELISLKGGWNALTREQKDKVLKHIALDGDGII